MEKLESCMEKSRIQEERRKERTQRNIQILRDDLYQGIMKPFFAEGEDYKEFQVVVLKDDIVSAKV